MGAVTLSGVRKFYGAVEVVKGIDLTVADRELVVFIGLSGCGKSTLLRMIAGLQDVDAGSIDTAGRDVTDLAPALRRVAMVFQNYALYAQITDLLARRPKAMSDGQPQRVAIGRAIVGKPQLFLFDEPLSNLDASL